MKKAASGYDVYLEPGQYRCRIGGNAYTGSEKPEKEIVYDEQWIELNIPDGSSERTMEVRLKQSIVRDH